MSDSGIFGWISEILPGVITTITNIDMGTAIQRISWLAAVLSAVGVLAMAVWQFMKRLLFVHYYFNQLAVRRWLIDLAIQYDDASTERRSILKWVTHTAKSFVKTAARRALGTWSWFRGAPGPAKGPAKEASKEYDEMKALHQMERLATGGGYAALYALETSRLTAQIGAAAQSALVYPLEPAHSEFFRILTGPIGAEYLDLVGREQALLSGEEPEDMPVSSEATINVVHEDGRTETRKIQSSSLDDLQDRITHVERKLGSLIQRRIDALQIRLAFWWQMANRLASTLLSGYFIWVLVSRASDDNIPSSTVIAAVVAGGLIAPLAKDLAVALSNLRGAASAR